MNKRFFLLFLMCATAMVSLFAQAPQAVDLGLSVKWADRNLDAATQYDDGLPYQWGETTPKQKQFSPTDYFCRWLS